VSTGPSWENFYNAVKGPDWPACPLEKDFKLLPEFVQKELIEFGYVGASSDPRDIRQVFDANGINVYYYPENDGGGRYFGQDYIRVIKEKYPGKTFNNCYEWCAGPGFIGYALLSNNLCNHLYLTDIWPPAIVDARVTQSYLQDDLKNCVRAEIFEKIEFLPNSWKFDLIVANPPHYHNIVHPDNNTNRIGLDSNWDIHKEFYKHIGSHLNDDGIILIQESYDSSSLDTFKYMIEENGLEITNCFDSRFKPFYFIEVRHLTK